MQDRPWTKSRARAGWTVTFLAVASAGCTVIAGGRVHGNGIGARCGSDDDCHAGSCDLGDAGAGVVGICVAPCAANSDCPAPSVCAAGKCSLPQSVGALWVGVVAGGEGWTLTHQEGMQNAAPSLPWMTWQYKEDIVPNTGIIGQTIDDLVQNQHVQVVIANSFSQRDEVLPKATQYPNVKFLTCASYKSNGTNAGSYVGRFEQAWYVAGQVAAAKAKQRLGVVGSFITSESVRYINAFLLGARTVNPNLVVEVNWLGFWYDYNTQPTYTYKTETLYREELLAARLLDSGCEVIAHLADNQRSVRYIEKKVTTGVLMNPRWSMSNDNQNGYRQLTGTGPGNPLVSCLGGAYWNWAPLYVRLLDEIHRSSWDPNVIVNDEMRADSQSVFSFQLNPNVGIDDSSVAAYINDIVQKGHSAVFAGPYATTGQRDQDGDGLPDPTQSVAAGEVLSDTELRSMCWFAKGVVMKSNPLDPTSPDVDAKVPDSMNPPAPDVLGPPGAPAGVGFDCKQNE